MFSVQSNMPNPTTDLAIREQLVKTLRGGNAFETFDEIVGQVSAAQRFSPPNGKGKSAWQIVDHMRRTLEDLIGFIDNGDGSYRELNWPEDYWPKEASPEDEEGWNKSLEGFHKALTKMEALVLDTGRELAAPFPWGTGQTLLHEALLAIEHTAYHLGELVELTQVSD